MNAPTTAATTTTTMNKTDWHLRALLLGVLAFGFLLAAARPAPAGDAEKLVETSRFTVQRLLDDKDFFKLHNYLRRAKGVLIIPQLIKGGLILGAEAGSGVLMVRGSDGTWSPPAFYTLAAGSIGLQIGGQVSEVVFTVMNDGAVDALLKNEFKLGADISVAVGPLGAGLEASATTNFDADVLAFSKSAGLFGGGALEGAKIFERPELSAEFYGVEATPRSILIERRFNNTAADRLRAAIP